MGRQPCLRANAETLTEHILLGLAVRCDADLVLARGSARENSAHAGVCKLVEVFPTEWAATQSPGRRRSALRK